MVPKPASLKCSDVFISGMRLAQLAKDNPWQKKKTDTAIRTCALVKEVVIDESMVNLNIIVKIN